MIRVQVRRYGIHQGADAGGSASAGRLVHHVAEGEPALGGAEAQRTAGAEVAERGLARAERAFGLGELEAEAEPGRPVQHQVLAVHLLGGGFGQGGGIYYGRARVAG